MLMIGSSVQAGCAVYNRSGVVVDRVHFCAAAIPFSRIERPG